VADRRIVIVTGDREDVIVGAVSRPPAEMRRPA